MNKNPSKKARDRARRKTGKVLTRTDIVNANYAAMAKGELVMPRGSNRISCPLANIKGKSPTQGAYVPMFGAGQGTPKGKAPSTRFGPSKGATVDRLIGGKKVQVIGQVSKPVEQAPSAPSPVYDRAAIKARLGKRSPLGERKLAAIKATLGVR